MLITSRFLFVVFGLPRRVRRRVPDLLSWTPECGKESGTRVPKIERSRVKHRVENANSSLACLQNGTFSNDGYASRMSFTMCGLRSVSTRQMARAAFPSPAPQKQASCSLQRHQRVAAHSGTRQGPRSTTDLNKVRTNWHQPTLDMNAIPSLLRRLLHEQQRCVTRATAPKNWCL